jgi:mono/diheme cytochrome c family protein
MKLPDGRPQVDIVDNAATTSRLPYRLRASGTLWTIVIWVIAVTGSALIFCIDNTEVHAATRDSKSAGAPTGNVENGNQLFKKYGCYECHGSHGQIASRAGPALAPNPVPFEGFVSYVRHPAGSMPTYTEKVVSDQELADIYAFLQSTSNPPAPKTVPLLNLVALNAAPTWWLAHPMLVHWCQECIVSKRP